MRKNMDPVDRALESLRGREWPVNQLDPQLENKLMRSFESHKTVPLFRGHRVLFPVLGLLLVAGVSFAATGGIALIQSWFVTVTVDGQTETHEVAANEDGGATFSVPLPPASGDTRIVEIELDSDELPPLDGQKTVSVNLSAAGEEADITITPLDATPDE